MSIRASYAGASRVVVAGAAGNQQTPNLPSSAGSRVIAFTIGNQETLVNDTTGQVALASAPTGRGGESEPPDKSTGTAPYTKQQVAQGRESTAGSARCATVPICKEFPRRR